MPFATTRLAPGMARTTQASDDRFCAEMATNVVIGGDSDDVDECDVPVDAQIVSTVLAPLKFEHFEQFLTLSRSVFYMQFTGETQFQHRYNC